MDFKIGFQTRFDFLAKHNVCRERKEGDGDAETVPSMQITVAAFNYRTRKLLVYIRAVSPPPPCKVPNRLRQQ